MTEWQIGSPIFEFTIHSWLLKSFCLQLFVPGHFTWGHFSPCHSVPGNFTPCRFVFGLLFTEIWFLVH